MSAAFRIAGFLRYAALQFLVLTPAAMAAYAGGTWWNPDEPHYRFAGNFLSDLGMTHAFSGRANTLLACYVATATTVMWRNGLTGARLAANLGYLVLVLGYVVLVLAGPRLDTPAGHHTQVIGQKIIAYGSMLHVLYLATTVRRQLRAS